MMKKCSEVCVKCEVSCPAKDCRYWIDYKEDLNCTLIAVKKNGSMTLRQISDRIGVSFVRVKQIEDKLKKKLKYRFSKLT